jgi:anti-anti-sigma factor
MSPIIEGKIEDGVLHAALSVNRLDASSSQDFKKQVEAIWSPEVSRVELDFEKVDFIDSSGVGALLGVYKRLPGDEPNVRLKRVQAPVQSVIELLRLHRIFDISN